MSPRKRGAGAGTGYARNLGGLTVGRYLITGGAGFIGSHIVGALVDAGHDVRVIDNFATGKKENIASYHEDIDLIEGDIRDLRTVERAVRGAEYILHQAALPSVSKSVADPISTNETNITGTLNVLVAARDAGVKRLVYASSSSVYGMNPSLPKKEDMEKMPASPYALQKYAGEVYCRLFYKLYGLETVMLRYFNIFGPRQDPTSQYAAVIPKFITRLQDDQASVIYGDGEQSRDFTYIENVVRANLLAAEAPGVAGEAMNIACGERTDLKEIVKLLHGLTGSSIPSEHVAARPGDVKHSHADITKARELLGYEPAINLREGLKHTVAYLARQRSVGK